MLKEKRFLLFIILLVCIGLFVASVNAAAAKYTFKFADTAKYSSPDKPPLNSTEVGARMFKKLVEENSNGEIEVQLYGGGVLGSDVDVLENVRAGSIAICFSSASNATAFVPELAFFGLNYLFKDYNHIIRALYDNKKILNILGQKISERQDTLKLLALTFSGNRNLYNRIRPIYNVEDVKGLKIRVMAAPIEAKVWSAVGALPASIASTELYSALQAGVVDGGESSMSYIYAEKYYEVAPYIALTGHKYNVIVVVMNQKIFEELPTELQEVVQEAADEAFLQQIVASEEIENEVIKKLKEMPGVTFTEPEIEGFMEKVVPLIEELAKELGVTEINEIIKSTK